MSQASLALSNLRGIVIVIVLAFHSSLAYLASVPAQTARFDQAPYTWQAFPIIDDARVRRAKLAIAAVVHQVQYLGVVEHVLGEASISYHFHASNLRTLLAFFGPWAPVIVLVPEEQASLARDKLDAVLRAAINKVPVARVHD